MVAGSTLLGLLIAPRWGTAAVDLLYLPAVLGAAVLGGLRPALLAALASTLAYNFFFTAPRHTLRIQDPADVLTVAALFVVAVVTSQLAASVRRQARLAAAHAARNATIAGLARRLLSCTTEAEIAETACSQLAGVFGCNVVMVAGEPLRPTACVPAASPLTPSDMGAAAVAIETGEPAGRGTGRAGPIEWQFHPVRSATGVRAALGLARDDGGSPVPPGQRPLLVNLLDQVALAMERTQLETEAREVATLRERDRLRSALLSSVGHDLRTPLTAIIAAAAELRRQAVGDPALADAVASEAARLERYIANLLDMARLEAGSVKLKVEAVDLVDAVSAALRDVRASLAGHAVEVDLPADLPLVRADPQLLHHCLINLLDNAGRHSGDGTPLRVVAIAAGGGLSLSVEDAGPGLSAAGRAGPDQFAAIGGSDRAGGSGLGLAIVKAFAEAMAVELRSGDREGASGAVFTLRFPPHLTLVPELAADVR